MKSSLITKITILLLMTLSSSSFYAQDSNNCPRGSLSSRFCDRDGDMLADSPEDPAQWVNPYTLIFGTNPNHSFLFREDATKSFLQHMEKVTGKKVKFFPYQTNSAQHEALRSGLLHIAGLNTGSLPSTINCTGFHLFAMRAKEDNSYGYKMEIVTYAGSGINKVSDIKGEEILFVSPSSNSGYKAPMALLKQRFKMQNGMDYQSRFSGSHSNSIVKVAHKKFRVAAVASGLVEGLVSKNIVPKDSVITLYSSESFPTTGYGYAHNLAPELAKKIEKAFMTFKLQDTPDGPLKPFNKYDDVKFIKADYMNKWEMIRAIDKASGVSNTCR